MFDFNILSAGAENTPENFWDKVLPALFTSSITTLLSVGVTIWIFTHNNRKEERKKKEDIENLRKLLKTSIQQTIPILKLQVETIKDAIERIDDPSEHNLGATLVLNSAFEPILKIPVDRVFEVFTDGKSKNPIDNYSEYITSFYALPILFSMLKQDNEEFENQLNQRRVEWNNSYKKVVDFANTLFTTIGEEVEKDSFLKEFILILQSRTKVSEKDSNNFQLYQTQIITPILSLLNADRKLLHPHKPAIAQLITDADQKWTELDLIRRKYKQKFELMTPNYTGIIESLESVKL